jgi:hypothetical protein
MVQRYPGLFRLFLETPLQFIKYFLKDALLKRIVDCTAHKTIVNASQLEARSCTEIHWHSILTSVARRDSVRDYWNVAVGNCLVKNTRSF